jgi:hypothetical protein
VITPPRWRLDAVARTLRAPYPLPGLGARPKRFGRSFFAFCPVKGGSLLPSWLELSRFTHSFGSLYLSTFGDSCLHGIVNRDGVDVLSPNG